MTATEFEGNISSYRDIAASCARKYFRFASQDWIVEDIVQDTLLAAWGKAAKWRDPAWQFQIYVCGIARHITFNALKRLPKTKPFPIDLVNWDSGVYKIPEQMIVASAEDVFLEAERMAEVATAFYSLPTWAQRVLRDEFLNGVTQDKQAIAQSVTSRTIRNWKRRSMERFKIAMGSVL